MKIWDVSPLLHPGVAVWPGDSGLSREVLLDLERGDGLTLSTLRATVHLGAHADAPSHYARGAPTIGERPLELYLGAAELLRVRPKRGTLIEPDDLPRIPRAPRVLLATGSFPDPDCFSQGFTAVSPALVEALGQQGVRLLGVDTPSVDPFDSKELPAHHTALRHDMALLEGLVLRDVPEGIYELIALPLRLAGFDASPVRAVLRTITDAPERIR